MLPDIRNIKIYLRTVGNGGDGGDVTIRERIIHVTDDDYVIFQRGESEARRIISKHLTSEELSRLVTWETEDQKLITTFVKRRNNLDNTPGGRQER